VFARPGEATTTPAAQRGARGQAPNATITLNPVADAYVYSASPTTNYGTATTLYVGSQSTSATGRALFRFDLSSIPAGATVQSATFQAYLVQSSSSPTTLDVELKRIDAPWQEMAVIWNTQPGYTGANNVTGVGTAVAAIDAGSAGGAPLDDFDGHARDSTPDIGVYEWGATGPAATPTPTMTPTLAAEECLRDVNRNGRGDVVDVIAVAQEPLCHLYLPIALRLWQ